MIGAHDVEPFLVDGTRFIAIANQGDGISCGNNASGVDVYVHRRGDPAGERSPLFTHHQTLPTGCAVFAHAFEAHGALFLAVAVERGADGPGEERRPTQHACSAHAMP